AVWRSCCRWRDMTYVCLWIPAWRTGAGPQWRGSGEAAPEAAPAQPTRPGRGEGGGATAAHSPPPGRGNGGREAGGDVRGGAGGEETRTRTRTPTRARARPSSFESEPGTSPFEGG